MAALEITDAAGSVLQTLTYPLTVRTTDRASALGEMVFSVYVGSPGASSLTPGVYVRWTDASYVFWGLAETVTRAEQEDGSAILTVKAIDIAREMALLTLGPTMFSGASTPMALQSALDLLALDAVGWTVTAAADVVAETVYLAADGASQWTMLLSLADKMGAWVFRGAGRTCTLTRNFTASGVTARSVSGDKPANVAALLSVQNTQDLSEVVNHVFPFSAGNAAMRLNLNMASASPPSGTTRISPTFINGDGSTTQWYGLRHFASFSAYGKRQRAVQFPDISPLSNSLPDITNAANALQAAAARYLLDHAMPQRALQLTMDDAPSIVSPGKTLHVTEGDIDGDYRVLEASHAWAPNLTVRSSLSLVDSGRAPATDASESVRSIEQARTYAAHAQLAPNVYQLGFNKPVDAQYGADFRFRFDEGITQVLMVALDVQLGPLQSTVRAIGAQAVKTSAVTQGAHTHFLRLAAHQHFMGDHLHSYTVRTAAHTHQLRFKSPGNVTPPTTDIVTLHPTTKLLQVSRASAGADELGATESAGTATTDTTGTTGAAVATADGLIVTSDNANYTAAAAGASTHDHTVDISVSMDYGIFRDSAGNTFAMADLEYQINSGAWAPMSGATSLGDGWYRLPLTNALVDAVTFYPLNKSNRVTIRAVVASAANETFVVGGTPSGQFNRWDDAGTYQQQITGTAATALALSANNWLYLLRKAAGTVTIYQPGTGGALTLWDTWTIEANRYNDICVDVRTGAKWWAGDAGQITGNQGGLKVIAGTPNLTSIAAYAGYIYASGGTSVYRMNSNQWDWPVISAAAGTSNGLAMAARNDGRIAQLSISGAAFQIKLWESDLSAFTYFTRSDVGNTWTALSIASAANLIHIGCSDGKVRTYVLDAAALTATLVFTSPGTPGATGYPSATSLLGVSAVISRKAAMIDAQLTVRSVVQGIVMT